MNSPQASSKLLYFTERGLGPPLLLLHGLMVTGEMFEPVIDHFAARHRVIVPDLRGHGRSRDLPLPYTNDQLASDLARLLDHLGIESASVLGYSNGGAVAQQLALDYPERCDRLMLVCTYAYNLATPIEWIEGHLLPPLIYALGPARFADFGISQVKLPEGKGRTAFLAAAKLMADQDRKKMEFAFRDAMAFDSRSRLAEIQCPTLIVAAANDQAVPMHHAKMLHDGIHGSQLVIIDDADHTLIWTHTDELLRVVDEFLEA
jgi:pimeloyl-ACP methyl ester carboxylesterase